MTMELKLALFGGVVPGAITLAALVLAWRVFGGRPSPKDTDNAHDHEPIGPVWVAPVLVLIALVLGDYTKNGWATLWPDDNTYRYPHAIAVLAVVGVLEALIRMPGWVAWVVRAAAFAGVFWMLSEGYHPRFVPTPWFAGLMIAGALGGASVATLANQGAAHLRGWAGPALVALLFAGVAPVLMIGHLSYGMHAATPMIAFGVAGAIAGIVSPRFTLARGAMTPLVGVVFSLVIGAGIQSEVLSIPSLVVLSIAPAAFGIAWIVRTKKPIVRAVCVAAVLVAMLGAAAGLALNAARADAAEDEYDPYAMETGAGNAAENAGIRG